MPIYERMTIQGRGGALPQYQSNQTPYVPGQGVTARLSDARGQLEGAGQQAKYKALARLGKAVDGAVEVGLKAYEDYSKTKATELVTKYKMGMRQSMYGEGGILTREGETAFTANADTMKRSKEMRAELLKDMGGSRVEQIFNQLIDPEEAEYSLKAQEYEGKQYRVFQDRTDKAAFSEAAEMAITGYADPKSFAKGTGEALWFQEQLLRRQGYSGEALDRGLKESSSKIFAGGIEQALAANDLASARRLLAEGTKEWKQPVPHDLSKVGGVVEKGNIDIDNRKVERLPDGTIKTVESFSFEENGVEVLIPTVIDGKTVSKEEAIAHYAKTGEHLGKFNTPEAATEYAVKLHENHAIQYGKGQSRMTAEDAAKARKAIDTKAEALENKAEKGRNKDAKRAAIAELGNINALIANCDPNDFAAQEAAVNSELERIAQEDPELALALAPLTSKRLSIAKQNYVSQTGQQYTAWMENSDFVNAEPQAQLTQIEQAHARGQLTDDAFATLWKNVTSPVKVSDPADYNELSANIASFKDENELTVAAKNRRISDDDLKILKAQLKLERELGKEFEAELKEYFKFMEEKHGMNANSKAKTGQQFRMFVTQTIDDWRKANNGKRPSMAEVRVLMDEAVKDVVFKKGWIRDEKRPLYLAYSEIGPVAWEEIRRQIAEEHDKPLSAVTDEEIIATANRPDNADAGEDEEYTVDYGYSFTRGR